MPAKRGPQPIEIVLSADERETLERWARRATTSQSLALRCRIVLACAEGGSNTAVAGRLGIADSTVRKWRRRICDDDVERVIVKTLEEKPSDNPRPYVWHKTADEILDTLAQYCARINDARH